MRLDIAKIEAVFILCILLVIAALSGPRFSDWSAALAVFMGFLYAQKSFDAAERLSKIKSIEATSLDEEIKKIFVFKEIAWVITFMSIGSYPLVFGAIIFSVYPTVRKFLRNEFKNSIFVLTNNIKFSPNYNNAFIFNSSLIGIILFYPY